MSIHSSILATTSGVISVDSENDSAPMDHAVPDSLNVLNAREDTLLRVNQNLQDELDASVVLKDLVDRDELLPSGNRVIELRLRGADLLQQAFGQLLVIVVQLVLDRRAPTVQDQNLHIFSSALSTGVS